MRPSEKFINIQLGFDFDQYVMASRFQSIPGLDIKPQISMESTTTATAIELKACQPIAEMENTNLRSIIAGVDVFQRLFGGK